MKTFPSALIRGGTTVNPINGNSSLKDQLVNSFVNGVNSGIGGMTSGKGFDSDGIEWDEQFDYKTALDEFDFTKKFNEKSGGLPAYYPNSQLFPSSFDKNKIENVYRIGTEVFNQMNNYRGFYPNMLVIQDPAEGDEYIEGKDEKGKDIKKRKIITRAVLFKKVTPSLFNPLHGVISNSITDNVPLLDNIDASKVLGEIDIEVAKNISDCSIKELVRLSKEGGADKVETYNTSYEEEEKDDKGKVIKTTTVNAKSKVVTHRNILGNAKYKYADFMYCKHLGQVSNNHLITLRRFTMPVGDDINQTHQLAENMQPDIARLVTWFGTEDNKLESIMNYTVEASWKEFNSSHEEQQSQEEDSSRGVTGNMANLMSATYQKQMLNGLAMNPLIQKMLGSWGAAPTYAGNPAMNGSHYDKNKIYEPANTIRSTHKYEGELKFNHEFTLKFSYKLRAYDNINPKSAFLDLLGNILIMTYRRGGFWGGSRSVIGPTTNRSVWGGAEKIIKGIETGVMDAFGPFFDGNFDWKSSISKLAETFKGAWGDIKEFIDGQGGIGAMFGNLGKGFLSGILGGMHNKMGRPAAYSFSSMLDGSPVGVWHVTIGNPKNPIASFGNMIVTKSKITHSGPLGIDDFPTELTVEITLKHARPRDSSEIQRMYTRGMRSIYYAYSTATTTSKDKALKQYNKNNMNGYTLWDSIKTTDDYFNTSVLQDNERIKTIREQAL